MTAPEIEPQKEDKPKASNESSSPFVYVFFSIFLLTGLGVIVQTIFFGREQLLSEVWLGKVVFGTVFSVVGAGMMFLTYLAGLRERRTQELRERHPNAPWKWDVDWDKGFSRASDSLRVRLLFFMGFFFLMVPVPLHQKILDGIQAGDYKILIALVFPLAGLFMWLAYFNYRLRARKFGNSRLKFECEKGVLGGKFKAQLEVPFRFDREQKFQVLVNCRRTVQRGRSGKRSKWVEVLWQEEFELESYQTGTRTTVHIDVPLPYDLTPTEESKPNEKIEWEVIVSAEVKGVDFYGTYPIPVFRDEAADPDQTRKAIESERAQRIKDWNFQFKSLKKITTSDGETAYRVPRSFRTFAGFGPVLFGLIFLLSGGGFFYVLFQSGSFMKYVAFTVPLVFVLVGLLLLLIGIAELFVETTIVMQKDSIAHWRGYLFWTFKKTYNFREIRDLELTSQSKSGNKIWYDIKVNLVHGRPRTMACRVPIKREIEYLIHEIESIGAGQMGGDQLALADSESEGLAPSLESTPETTDQNL